MAKSVTAEVNSKNFVIIFPMFISSRNFIPISITNVPQLLISVFIFFHIVFKLCFMLFQSNPRSIISLPVIFFAYLTKLSHAVFNASCIFSCILSAKLLEASAASAFKSPSIDVINFL